MSVQSEIGRIKQNVADTYTALNELGADMPEEQNSNNLAAAVRSLANGLNADTIDNYHIRVVAESDFTGGESGYITFVI